MVRELETVADNPPEDVMVYEVGRVLEGAADRTRAASAGAIRGRMESAEYTQQPEDLYTPRWGRSGVTRRRGGLITYKLSNRYPDALWRGIERRRRASVRKKLKARGLAKKSWLQIADKIPVSINIPGYARSAIATSGVDYDNTQADKIRGHRSFGIIIKNAQPTVNLPIVNGKQALSSAIDGRVAFFITNVTRGVFEDMAQAARKYPGIKIKH